MLTHLEEKRDAAEEKWIGAGQPRAGYFQRQLDDAQSAVTNAKSTVNELLLAAAGNGNNGTTTLFPLPAELRVFGEYTDELPWKASESAAAAAVDLVTAASTIDEATDLEIIETRSSLFETGTTGKAATIFVRGELRQKWDALWHDFHDPRSRFVRGGIAGTAGTGKSWSLNYVLRRALRQGRPVVAELRKAPVVYLLAPSGPFDPEDPDPEWSCDAWRVAHEDFKAGGCALLFDSNTVFLIDTASTLKKPSGRVPAVTFTTRSKDRELTKEDIVKDGGRETETSTYSLAELRVLGKHLGVPPDVVERRFLVAGGRPRALFSNTWVDKMVKAVEEMPLGLLQSLGGGGDITHGTEGFEGPSALVTADPNPEYQARNILTERTRCYAASPVALTFLSVAWARQLNSHVGLAAGSSTAGRIFEEFARSVLSWGGDFHAMRLTDTGANSGIETLSLPPATIITSPKGESQSAAFMARWKQLPLLADAAVDPGVSFEEAAHVLLRMVSLVPPHRRAAVLPRYETDFRPLLLRGDEEPTLPRSLLVCESLDNNYPNFDAVDTVDRAYSMKSGKFHNASLKYIQLKNQLAELPVRQPGEDNDAPKLQVYWVVTKREFDGLVESQDSNSPQTTRRPLSGKNVKDEDVASLRECFDEWVMCPPDFNTDRFSDAAEHLFRWNE